MYWVGNWNGQEERIYADGAEYGVRCRVQDLETLVKNIDRYLKKTKVRSGGLCKRFGVSCGTQVPGESCWMEWLMDAGCGKGGLRPDQGYLWHFELGPNRRFLVDRAGNAQEVWLFPERRDLAYVATLLKHHWYYLRDGREEPFDDPVSRAEREAFFQGLLAGAAFPLELLHIYAPEERLRLLPQRPAPGENTVSTGSRS